MSEFNFESCMKCTICTAYCPMMAVNPLYPGPKQAGPDGERFRIKDAKAYDEALKYCMNCKRCEVNCPSGVKVGDIIQSARLKYGKQDHKLRGAILGNTDFVGNLASAFAPIANPVLSWKLSGAVMDAVLGVDKHRHFPSYSSQKFTSWFGKEVREKQASFSHQVSYYHGCSVNYNMPEIGKDFVTVMNALGYGVNLLEDEKCCGVALISNGFDEQARKNAEINLSEIRKSAQQGRVVLTTSSTCTFTMRDEYVHILGLDNSDVRENIQMATRYIYKLLSEGRAKVAWKEGYKVKLAYHTPCHLEKLGWGIYSTELLRMIPGVELTILDRQCCGIAGTFGFKKENYEYSQKIGSVLFDLIKEADPDFVATDCETCKWQIEMSTSYKVKHPVSILAEAIDIEKTIELNR